MDNYLFIYSSLIKVVIECLLCAYSVPVSNATDVNRTNRSFRIVTMKMYKNSPGF